MRTPIELRNLVDDGTIDEVLRPLMSGKEAQIYLVRSRGQQCVAKVYKRVEDRSFKQRAEYTEGRKLRGSRDQRALNKGSRHGRERSELAWRSTEADTIYKLHAAGVRVPRPLHYAEGVLVMELVTDEHGRPAPRLGELRFSPSEAEEIHRTLLQQVVRMVCAGVVHGDLSDFNVLIGANGPVLIDFPQASDPAQNRSARKLLLRDVENLQRFLARFVPGQRRLPYGEEIWQLLEQRLLLPDTRLSGQYRESTKRVNTDRVLELVHDADRDEARRRSRAAENAPSRLYGAMARGEREPRAARPESEERDGGQSREVREPRRVVGESATATSRLPKRPTIVIPTSHRRYRAPTGDWSRGRSGDSGRSTTHAKAVGETHRRSRR